MLPFFALILTEQLTDTHFVGMSLISFMVTVYLIKRPFIDLLRI
jgi:hypothetical protein